MKTIKIRTAKICVTIILNDHLSSCAKAHSLLEFFVFFPFMGQHVIDQKFTSSQARSRVRPPFEPCERVLTKQMLLLPVFPPFFSHHLCTVFLWLYIFQ